MHYRKEHNEDSYFRSYGGKRGDDNTFDINKVIGALNFIKKEFSKPYRQDERHLQFAIRLTHQLISEKIDKLLTYIKEER